MFYNTNVDVTNGYGGYKPGTNKFSVTQKVINIWKAHGFYWVVTGQERKTQCIFIHREADDKETTI